MPSKKNHPLLVLSLLCSGGGIAQPVLTAGDAGLQIGDAYGFDACGPLNFPNEGAGMTWNYNDLGCGASGQVNIIDPTTTGGSAFFPAATVADQPPGFPDAQYWATSATEQLWLGYYASPEASSICSDPRTDYIWPLTFGTTFTDSMICAETGFFPRTRYGLTTVSCTGYGTLNLPYGEFSDCLLVHKHWDFQDVYEGIAIGVVVGDSYSFLKAGIHVPLLSMGYSTYTQGDTVIVNQGSTLLSENSTGARGPKAAAEVFQVMPVPCDRTARFVSARELSDGHTLEVFDARGLRVEHLSVSGRSVPIACDSWSSGIYSVRLSWRGVPIGHARMVVE